LIYNSYTDKIYQNFNNKFRETGFGINEKMYPVELFNFMKREKINEIGKRPFNSMRIGGLFIWSFPDAKNFIDSRNLNDSIMGYYFQVIFCKNGFEKRFESFNIDYIIYSMPNFASQPFEAQVIFMAYLSKNVNWKLIYWDDKSFLFVRNEQKFSDLISKYEYKYLTPLNCVYNRPLLVEAMKKDWQKLTLEIRRNLNENKNSVLLNDVISHLNFNRMIGSFSPK
jgi:hypothetical protein